MDTHDMMSGSIEHDYAPICDLYDRHLGPVLFEPYAIDLARHVANCTTGSVLEMACGTGIVTRQLRAHLKPSVTLTATDINPGMLDYAQKKLNATDGITWKQTDIADLPFLDASFNVAACQFGLMFVQHKDRAFREMRRVLVTGGLLAFTVWDRMEDYPWGIIAHEIVGGFFPENPPQFFKAPCSFYDVDVLRKLLAANGFDKVNIQKIP
ncbi:MAG TPA: class I SAM-dependent methyltransferase, partial [Nitrospira sp.]|nr:class I SAM-dependent methyltransferase [Nitrospira sp.]